MNSLISNWLSSSSLLDFDVDHYLHHVVNSFQSFIATFQPIYEVLLGHIQLIHTCISTMSISAELWPEIPFIVLEIILLNVAFMFLKYVGRKMIEMVARIMLYVVSSLSGLGRVLQDFRAPRGTTRVNCWYCSSDIWVTSSLLHGWRCPSCEQYNGFTDDGDHNAPPEVVYGVSHSHVHSHSHTSSVRNSNSNRSGRNAASTSPSSGSDVKLCAICQHRMDRWLTLRTQFEPKSTEEEALFEEELLAESELCEDCQLKADRKIEMSNRMISRGNLSRAFQRSRSMANANANNPIERQYQYQGKRRLNLDVLLFFLYRITKCIFWVALISNIIIVAWNYSGLRLRLADLSNMYTYICTYMKSKSLESLLKKLDFVTWTFLFDLDYASISVISLSYFPWLYAVIFAQSVILSAMKPISISITVDKGDNGNGSHIDSSGDELPENAIKDARSVARLSNVLSMVVVRGSILLMFVHIGDGDVNVNAYVASSASASLLLQFLTACSFLHWGSEVLLTPAFALNGNGKATEGENMIYGDVSQRQSQHLHHRPRQPLPRHESSQSHDHRVIDENKRGLPDIDSPSASASLSLSLLAGKNLRLNSDSERINDGKGEGEGGGGVEGGGEVQTQNPFSEQVFLKRRNGQVLTGYIPQKDDDDDADQYRYRIQDVDEVFESLTIKSRGISGVAERACDILISGYRFILSIGMRLIAYIWPLIIGLLRYVLVLAHRYSSESQSVRSGIAKEAWMWSLVGITAALRWISAMPFLLYVHVGSLMIIGLHYAALGIGGSYTDAYSTPTDSAPKTHNHLGSTPRRRSSRNGIHSQSHSHEAFLSSKSHFVRDALVAVLLIVLLWKGVSELYLGGGDSVVMGNSEVEQFGDGGDGDGKNTGNNGRYVYIQGKKVLWDPDRAANIDIDIDIQSIERDSRMRIGDSKSMDEKEKKKEEKNYGSFEDVPRLNPGRRNRNQNRNRNVDSNSNSSSSDSSIIALFSKVGETLAVVSAGVMALLKFRHLL